MDRVEPKHFFPKETRILTTSVNNAVHLQDMNYCTTTKDQSNITSMEQHDRAQRRIDTTQPTKEQHNTSPRRSTTERCDKPDCLITKINQQEPLGFGRAELKARRREEDWSEIGGKSTYIRPMHGEEAATSTLKLLLMSGSISNVSYHCQGQQNYGGKVPYVHRRPWPALC